MKTHQETTPQHTDQARFLEIDNLDEKSKNTFSDHVPQTETQSAPSLGVFEISKDPSTLLSILTLLAATIGTGILMIPNSVAPSGVVWGPIQMIFCGYLSFFSLMTLVKCGNYLNLFSYQDIALHTYGHWCRQLANVFNFFANWGSAILYLKLTIELFAATARIIIGGEGKLGWLTDPRSKILGFTVATIFVLPLSLAKQLKGLNYFCIINICCILLFCYVVVYESYDYQPLSRSFETSSFFQLSGIFTTFPASVFAYMSHTNVLDVFKELPDPTVRKMRKVVKYTVMFVLITYTFVGIIGYATFSGNLSVLSNVSTSNGIILVAYGYNLFGQKRGYSTLVIITMITMILSIIISQPFNIIPAKESLRNFFKPFDKAHRGDSDESDIERFLYISFTLYSCLVIAVYFDSLQMILDVVGSMFFTILCFVLPSLFYLKIYSSTISKKDKIIHWSMMVFNIFFAVWNTIENVWKAAK